MRITQFENEPVKTNFAPVFNFNIYEDVVDVNDIKSVILSKEKDVINNNPYTDDWNTGLGKDSMTSRSNCYNLLKWDEADFLKETIRTAHDNFITSLGYDWENKIYLQCWANVLRNGQFLKQHQHWNSEYTYLGGHICLDDYDTSTYYINPYNRKPYISKNSKGNITLFPNWIEHYTDPYEGGDVRVSIAFDIITEVVYNDDIFENKKDHWIQL
tara:strand:- start:241 stop:882 length:642 start_codon:yes stop_codon:yes gene_type:complete